MKPLNVLTLTNLYPTRRAPHGGNFIDRRIIAQRKLGTHGALIDVSYRVLGVPRGSYRKYRHEIGTTFATQPLVSLREWGTFRRNTPSLKTLERYAAAIKVGLASRPDVIHAHGMYGPHAGTIARLLSKSMSIPYVVTLHGSDINDLTPETASQVLRTLEMANGCIFVSQALRQRAYSLGLAHSSRHFVIPNGVDTSIYSPSSAKSAKRPASPSLLYVGNLFPVKGVDRLPEIQEQLLVEYPEAKLTIIGDGPLRSQLEQAMVSQQTIFQGVQPPTAVAMHMANSSMLVLPSRSEGWPNVVLESYAAGTPVVATEAGGNKEAVGDLGKTVSNTNWSVSEFVRACIETFVEPPSAELLQARAAQYTWEVLAKHEDEALRSAIGNSE